MHGTGSTRAEPATMDAAREIFCNMDLLSHVFSMMDEEGVTRCMRLRSRTDLPENRKFAAHAPSNPLCIRTISWKVRLAFDRSARKVSCHPCCGFYCLLAILSWPPCHAGRRGDDQRGRCTEERARLPDGSYSFHQAIRPTNYRLYAYPGMTFVGPGLRGYSRDSMHCVASLTIDPSVPEYTNFLLKCTPFLVRDVQRVILSGEGSILGVMKSPRLKRLMDGLHSGFDLQIDDFDRQGSLDPDLRVSAPCPLPRGESDL